MFECMYERMRPFSKPLFTNSPSVSIRQHTNAGHLRHQDQGRACHHHTPTVCSSSSHRLSFVSRGTEKARWGGRQAPPSLTLPWPSSVRCTLARCLSHGHSSKWTTPLNRFSQARFLARCVRSSTSARCVHGHHSLACGDAWRSA